MIALFLVMLFTLVYQASLNAMSFLLHAHHSIFLVAPLVLVIVVFCFPIPKGLFILLCSGALIDSLTGGDFGTNILLMVFLGFFGMSLSSWLGKPHWPMVFSFLLGTSCLYRLILSQISNFGISNLLFGPLADAFVGMMIFYWMPRWVIKMD